MKLDINIKDFDTCCEIVALLNKDGLNRAITKLDSSGHPESEYYVHIDTAPETA